MSRGGSHTAPPAPRRPGVAVSPRTRSEAQRLSPSGEGGDVLLVAFDDAGVKVVKLLLAGRRRLVSPPRQTQPRLANMRNYKIKKRSPTSPDAAR